MTTRRSLRRSGARLMISAIAALSVTFSNSAHAVTTYSEEFEFGTTWTTTAGAGVDCTTANAGLCSLKIDPPCCSTGSTGSTALLLNTTPIVPSATVSFAFRGTDLYGDVDSGFTVKLDSGSVHLAVTEGVFPNNGVGLYGSSAHKPYFTAWPAAGVWNQVTLKLDGVNHTVTATVNGVPATANISATATRITGLEAGGIRWSGYGFPINYDSVRIDVP